MLPFSSHEHYFEALAQNDVAEVKLLLTQATSFDRKEMLNGSFEFDEDELPFAHPLLTRMTKPLLVAVMKGSCAVIEYMIQQGADVLQENSKKENIIHTLAVASYFELQAEESIVSVYKELILKLDKDKIRDLLMHENCSGFRPLEMAANLGCILLYEAIQLTPNVYVVKTMKKGFLTEKWIDVSEYESYEQPNRKYKCPLALFAHLDQDIALKKIHSDILKCEVLNAWVKLKLESYGVQMFCTVLFSLFFWLCYFTLLTRGHKEGAVNNGTGHQNCQEQTLYFNVSKNFAFAIILFVLVFTSINFFLGFAGLLFYMFCWRHQYMEHFITRKKKALANTALFMLMHVLNYFCYLLFAILLLWDNSQENVVLSCLTVIICTIIGWSVLQLTQLSHSVGHYSIAMERMVSVLLQFSVLFVVLFLPYVHTFYRLLQDKNGCPNSAFSSSVMDQYYNTFVVLLNMISVTSLVQDRNDTNYYLILILHISYVFLLSILLINFFIALLSHSVSEVMENKHIMMLAQKMSTLFILEACATELSFQRKVAQYFQRKHFVVKDNKIYFRVISLEKGR